MQTAVHRVPGLVLTDHVFRVPLDHDAPDGASLEVFAREVGREGDRDARRPWLVFLQGGPGVESPRPTESGGWIERALEDHRVLLLDQRGTGRSTAQGVETLARLASPEEQARHLSLFRADSIVRDCEAIRRELVGEDVPWTVLGQSFGGFCAVHYLSAAPEGLAGALITGGLPGLEATAEEVYRRTWPRVVAKNETFYRRYPEDVDRALRVARRLERGDVRLPCGDPASVRRFRTLGMPFGTSTGADELHYLLEGAFDPSGEELTHRFLRGVENAQRFDTNPFYAVLHEACYAQGGPTDWAAERTRVEVPDLDATGERILFTGEMVFPWMFEEMAALRPLREAADALAAKDDWPALYDAERLASNEVPVAAVVYFDDMYVDAQLSLETAARVRGLDPWVTNTYEHDGLRADGGRVLDVLLGRLRRWTP